MRKPTIYLLKTTTTTTTVAIQQQQMEHITYGRVGNIGKMEMEPSRIESFIENFHIIFNLFDGGRIGTFGCARQDVLIYQTTAAATTTRRRRTNERKGK